MHAGTPAEVHEMKTLVFLRHAPPFTAVHLRRGLFTYHLALEDGTSVRIPRREVVAIATEPPPRPRPPMEDANR